MLDIYQWISVRQYWIPLGDVKRYQTALLRPPPTFIHLGCGGQLLNVTFSFLSAMCIRWPGFVLIIVSCYCVIDEMSLGYVCCARLIRTLISVGSASIHLLLLEFDISELRPPVIHWSLKYQGVERPNLQGLSCRLRFECGMTFPTLCLIPERWMGSKVQSTVGCYPESCFLQFSLALVFVGLRKQLINNLVFLTWACAAGFNNNNNNNNNSNNKK